MTFYELVNIAKEQGASDIHITVGTSLAIRLYGELVILPEKPTAEDSRNMILEPLSDEQRSRLINGEDLDFTIMSDDGTRLRANIYHQRNNLAGTYRILNSTIPTFEELNIPMAIRKLADEPRGLVLVTGPTGSGKTTTLASMINYINQKKAKHVITIEDPIEYVYYHANSMIHQREVGTDVANFATALRSALREDPDIILVGEMRDYETISAAITAAETGHLVLSTLHTTSAAQTVERIIDAFPPHGQQQARTQLANVLKGVSTQQLIPGVDGNKMELATEVLINNEAIANQIRENKVHQIPSSIQSGVQQGMHSLNSDLRRLVLEQRITTDMARTYSNNVKDLDSLR